MPLSLRVLLKSAGTSFTAAEFPSGAVLFRQGDDCHDAWCIEEGRVRLGITSPGGQEAISGLLGAGALVSDDLLAGRREFRHSAVAVERTVVLRVPGDRMKALLRTQPSVLDLVLEHVLTKEIQLEDALVQQKLCLGEERLAHALVTLAQCDGAEGRCLLPHLSQEIIAEMIGTTRSRVNVFMNRFKKIGFIEADQGQLYVNPSRLSKAVQRS